MGSSINDRDLTRERCDGEDVHVCSEKNLVHLHVHTSYSLLDGYNKPKDCAMRAKELGMTHIAITDHNYVGGVIEFQKACKDADVKPILGCEMYWTFDTNVLGMDKDARDQWNIDNALKAGVVLPVAKGKKKITQKEINEVIDPYKYDTHQYHIILLAVNQTGWKNLVQLQSEAAAKCTFNGRYLCDDEMLAKHSEGLIMSTACIGNIVPKLINRGMYQEASDQLDAWHNIFGDRFFIEVQPLNIDQQRLANLQMIQMAKVKGIKIIATTDVHYTLKEDHEDHDTLICVGTGKMKSDTERMRYSNDFWIKSYDEMVQTFGIQADSMLEEYGSDIFNRETYMETMLEALETTNEIASIVEPIKLGSDVDLFPNLDIPFGMTAEGWLTLKCFQELYKYKSNHQEINLHLYEKRLNTELKVINTKGFAPYILVVQDYIDWANANGCPTGPGRGSGAGSLVLFVLGITKMIDPIKHNLLFFRFLTMDRTAPPDIDTDFEYYNRHRVIEYLEEKYGKQHVSHIGSYTEEGVRNGLKDVGRVLGIDFGIMNMLTKKVDDWSDNPSLKFKHLDALKDSDRESDRKAWEDFNKHELEYPELFRLVRAFEGTKRNTGVHASGILITPMPISDLFPTHMSKDGKDVVTFYTGVELEDLKAIKFDILGLKTLSVIKNTLAAIDASLTMDDLYRMVDVDDPQMFEMIQNKETEGLFQIESNLFKGMIGDIIPTSMNDITVINALGRPGPIKAGMPASYARRKNGEEEAIEPLKDTWEFVSETYGTIAYQEQIMLIAQRVAGYDDNQSDSQLRKAFAKKKRDKMAVCKQWFIYGKINKVAPEGYDVENFDQPMYDPKGKYGPAIHGGIANDYDEQELIAFWTNIEGFADYLFNKSHAACYAYICMLTGWLKTYYPAKFLAALLSVQDKEEKIDSYVKVARNMGIQVMVPNINLSEKDFAEVDGTILYGLGSVKGIGDASYGPIIANRPYAGIEDAITRIGSKAFNKKVAKALIQSGGFDWVNTNRNELINSFYDIRKDKDDRLDPEDYDELLCIELEKAILGSPVTYVPWWDEVQPGEVVEVELTIGSVQEKTDKNGNMMAFVEGDYNGCAIRAVVFSRQYCNNAEKFDMAYCTTVRLKGKKDDRGTFVVSKVLDKEKTSTQARQIAWMEEVRQVEERLGDAI